MIIKWEKHVFFPILPFKFTTLLCENVYFFLCGKALLPLHCVINGTHVAFIRSGLYAMYARPVRTFTPVKFDILQL